MSNLPDFSKKTDAELHVLKNQFKPIHEFHELAVTELCRRQELKEKENKAQVATSILWSRIAAIAAILGTIFAFAQIVIYFLEYNKQKTHTSPQIQQPTQNIQRPTKSQENPSPSKNVPPKNR